MGLNSHVMSITTTLGADKLLVLRMDGQEQLGRLPEWHVDLVGNVNLLGMKEHIDLHSLLGTRADVTIDLHGVKREFNGYVTRAQRGERHGRFEAFSIVMRPWLWFATRSRNSRVFQNKSVKDIVTAVLTPYSSDFAWRLLVASSYPTLEYCVQYDESDFDFVSRLLEEAGIYYFFEHTSTTHTMVLTDSMAKHRSKAGTSPIQWAHALKQDQCIMDWRKQEEVRAVKATVRDYDYLASATQIEQDHAALPLPATSFRVGSAELPALLKRQLDVFADVLKTKKNTDRQVRIIGHADATGTPAANQALSVKRAESVRDYLVGKGTDPALLVIEGVGSSDPKNPAKPNADENRRVEIGRK